MKGILKNIIAGVMLLIMATISPMTDLSQSLHTGAATAKAAGETAKAAENAGGKYITEVRLGMGPDKETAENYLTSNGFTVVKDGDNPFDLNWDAWKKSSKEWRGEANVVLLGYKTTNDPTDAITDLAVMNMEGGYSVEDYNQILKDNMETKIRPFMERFITTLNEYRENLEKPKDSENFKRADYVRKLLNKMTDDDTDGSPIGDLLINETKFELGDHEYNALSDSEKKKHADIITMFQQGDDIMIYLLGNLLARGADTSDNTWIDRLKGTTLDDLMEEVQAKSKSSGTKSDINAELDKKYEDKAKAVLSHWNELTEKLNDLSTAEQKVDEFDPDATQELKETLEDAADEDLTKEKIDELSDEIAEQFSDNADTVDAATTVSISEFLEKIDYDFDVAGNRGYTLLDFFKLEKADFSGDNIRYLYPIVDALSEGQLAGLDYLPIKDMILSVFSIESDADSSLKDVADAIEKRLPKTEGTVQNVEKRQKVFRDLLTE